MDLALRTRMARLRSILICFQESSSRSATSTPGTSTKKSQTTTFRLVKPMKSKDRHHIIPRVVCRDLGISPNFLGNIRRVRTSKHRAWHTLFGAATPDEAIEIIKREWSLTAEAQKEYDRLRGNILPLRRRQ